MTDFYGVHPRVCGGSRKICACCRCGTGTSPRVRGKPLSCVASRSEGRYIPACAGEAAERAPATVTRQVHPRVCGGSDRREGLLECLRGTSPRVRGKLRHARGGRVRWGYIPACAGEAAVIVRCLSSHRVHPRVCGGSSWYEGEAGATGGTSPRVRGKPCPVLSAVEHQRYIPACAGEARTALVPTMASGVHPRVCGGSLGGRRRFGVAGEPRAGTSPRVRGKLDAFIAAPADLGYIPACAGEASRSDRRHPHLQVHPRVCGGSQLPFDLDRAKKGTSPRVRGKLCGSPVNLLKMGYIPACAGEAGLGLATGGLLQVHPRVCGGSHGLGRDREMAQGTSPRVRGKLRRTRARWKRTGYIPACAGEAYGRSCFQV